MTGAASGPLDGFRVVEIAEGVAGPAVGMQLGDAGADVIKIEPPQGDRTRSWAPAVEGRDSVPFRSLNRNKRGVVVDWAIESDRALARRLLADADVVIVDLPELPHADLDPTLLGEQNPRLVYLAVSGYGGRGPWAHRPAADLPAQLSSETTASLGVTGEEPVRVGTDVGGMYAAIYGVQAVCAALWECETSGLGQRVDVSLFGSLIAMRSTLWVALSNPDEWWGFHLDSYAKPPDHGYQCADLPIYFSLARMDRDSMSALLADLEMPWVRDDPLFPLLASDTGGGTGRHAHEVHHLWERGFAKWPADQVMATIERHGGIAFPMNDYARLVAQPQVQETGVLARIPDGNDDDEFITISPPWEFSDTPASIRRGAPALGEHTAEIQAERREKVGPA